MKLRNLLSAVVKATTSVVVLNAVLACQLLGGVQVEPIAQTTNRPGQVAVYLSVRDGDGPVTRLEASNFRLVENEKQLDPAQVQLQLLPRDSVAVHQTLVLVDLSGPIDEPGRRALLAKQLSPFVDRLRMQQSVSVYGFDGGEKLFPIGKFGKQQATKKAADLSAIDQHKQADSSSNLNGAVLTAISQLDYELNADPRPVKLGRLVIIARGPDLAGRTTEDRVEERFDQVDHAVFALGVEREPNTGFSERLGRDGHLLASSFDNMESQLAELAAMIEADYQQYYLVSYCSPARAGERLLVIEVKKPEGDGGSSTGDTEIKFSADGFSSGCKASRVPRFSGGSTRRAAPPSAVGNGASDAPAQPDSETEEPTDDADTATDAVPPPASPTYGE